MLKKTTNELEPLIHTVRDKLNRTDLQTDQMQIDREYNWTEILKEIKKKIE